MTIIELGDALHSPAVLDKILAGYEGQFSVGVVGTVAQPAILLRVEKKTTNHPESVEINGEHFRLSVQEGYSSPVALKERT